jgi:hypothetical protein
MNTGSVQLAMPKRSSSKDPNLSAFSIVQKATDTKGVNYEPLTDPVAIRQYIMGSLKNPAAVMLGRLGGLKGGNARAKSLTKEQRSEIAKKAAKARWKG